ncbi:hypothetical protein GCM10027275_16640 [Rhabdobacter roseus]|uniref:Tape measure domain-containing protein n=1 Tax=Rhabdobacter roseus TaxID=1655419 RepID=A0A840TKX1_9BACT|nr:tape measure protein [Rhabdobacter roseus]MBB5283585.1 tape measure domain-containing protein [Rhabdobacter roseus]
MNNAGPLDFDAVIRNTDFKRSIDEMERRIMGFSGKIEKETRGIDETFKRLGQAAAGYFAFDSLKGLASSIVQIRGEFQQLEIAFGTMLGSKAKADSLMADVVKLAATTPFDLQGVASGAKQLLAYGAASEDVTKTLTRLGDIASGLSIPLNDIVYLYGTTMTQGRLYTQDLNQFTGRGIPMIRELAKQFGVAESEVKKLVETGKVGFPEVQKVIESLTNDGGMFAGLMEAQSKSLTGLVSNLGDAWQRALNDIGQSQEGLIADSLRTTISVVENYQSVLDILKVIVAAYGTYKAATIAIATAQRLVAASSSATLFLEMARGLGTVTTATYAQAVAIGIQTRAQAALNAVTAANPYVAAATAIIALSVAVWVLHDSTTAQEKAQERLNKAEEESKRLRDDLTSQTSQLVATIRSETATQYAQIEAYEKLQKLYPGILGSMTLQQFQLLKTEEAQRRLNAAMDQMGIDRVKQNYDEARKKVEELEKRINALLSTPGGDEASTAIAVKATRKELEVARIEAEKLGEAVEANVKREWEANTSVEDKKKHYEDLLKSLKEQRANVEKSLNTMKQLGGAAQGIQPILAQLSLDTLNAQIDQAQKGLKGLLGTASVVDGGNKAYWEKQKSEAQQKLNDLGAGKEGSADWKQLKKEIQEAEKQIDKYDTKVKKVAEKDKPQPLGSVAYWEQTVRKIDEAISKLKPSQKQELSRQQALLEQAQVKLGEAKLAQTPMGTLEYWEQVIKNADEVLKKTSLTDTDTLGRQMAIKRNAEKQAEDLRKATAVRSFEEELDEKRRKYEEYQRWVEFVGQDSADKQYATLLKSGRTYMDYLTAEIQKLEALRDSPIGLTPGESKNLVALNMQRDEASGRKTVIQAFTEDLERAQLEAQNLTEYLAYLKQAQESLNASAPTADVLQQRQLVAERMIETEKARKAQLRTFLTEVVGSEAKHTEITKYYEDLRQQLARDTADKNSEVYTNALQDIGDAEKREHDEQKIRLYELSAEYRALARTVEDSAGQSLRARISGQEAIIQDLSKRGLGNTDRYREEVYKLIDLNRELRASSAEAWGTISGIFGELGQSLSGINEQFGAVGRSLTTLGSQMGQLGTLLNKDSKVSLNQYAAVGEAMIEMAELALSAAQRRKDAEQQHYESAIRYQHELNLLVNEQIGMQAELNESIFFKDYTGRLKSGMAQLADAQQKYQESIAALSGGKAVTGMKNQLDPDAILKGGLKFGPVGAIWGAITGMKKVEVFGGLLETYPKLISETGEFNKELAQVLINTNQVDETTKKILQSAIDWADKVDEANKKMNDVISDLAGGLGSSLTDALVNSFREGTDAALAFGDTVGGVLEKILEQLIFSQVLGPYLDQLKADMTASMAEGGDGSWIDDFGRFVAGSAEATKMAFQAMDDAQKIGAQYGIDLWKKTGAGADAAGKGMSGAIKGVTEETASLLAGQINSIRINQAEALQVNRGALVQLTMISSHTAHLMSMSRDLSSLLDEFRKDTLRAKGLGGG